MLTLIINGPTAGPLLKKLGLITPTETREKVVENYRQHMISFVLKEYVELLTEPRFHDVDLNVVRDHIPFFSEWRLVAAFLLALAISHLALSLQLRRCHI